MKTVIILLACLIPTSFLIKKEGIVFQKEESAISVVKQQMSNVSLGTVEKIAELILVDVYGENVLEQKPWQCFETKDIYVVKGTFNKAIPNRKGGVAEIIISKDDLRILKCSHGK